MPTSWRPFDMKGLRLYKHEKRYASSFGAGGLRIGDARHSAVKRALSADVALLKGAGLVDFSYLVSVFRTNAPPRPCEHLWLDPAYHSHVAAASARGLLAASYIVPEAEAHAEGGEAEEAEAAEAAEAASATAEAAPPVSRGADMCMPVMVRVSLIDYLRAWRMTERMEHLHKTITRDLLAGQRNHAVVPTEQYAHTFVTFFDDLFTPLPHISPFAIDWSRWLHDQMHTPDAHRMATAAMTLPNRLAGWAVTAWASALGRPVRDRPASERRKATRARSDGGRGTRGHSARWAVQGSVSKLGSAEQPGTRES